MNRLLELDNYPLDIIYDIYARNGYEVDALLHIDEFIKTGDYMKLIDALIPTYGNKIKDITFMISRLGDTLPLEFNDLSLRDHINLGIKNYLESFSEKEGVSYNLFVNHIFSAIWICKHTPELNIYRV